MTDRPMDPDVLAYLRPLGMWPPSQVPQLLSAHDHWHRLVIRHKELRRQAEAVCERRTAELAAARAGTEAPILLTEINGLRAKIDELEDTLAATLENWEAYASELGGEQ